MTDDETKMFIRIHRARYFQEFDAKAIQYLSQGLEIPNEWLVYGAELRDLTNDINTTTRMIEGQLEIIWPVKPD